MPLLAKGWVAAKSQLALIYHKFVISIAAPVGIVAALFWDLYKLGINQIEQLISRCERWLDRENVIFLLSSHLFYGLFSLKRGPRNDSFGQKVVLVIKGRQNAVEAILGPKFMMRLNLLGCRVTISRERGFCKNASIQTTFFLSRILTNLFLLFALPYCILSIHK